MKYKVGDKVRVKQTLNSGQNYGGALANDAMASKSGEFVTIEEVLDNGYHIKEDIWYWTDEMLEPVSTDKPKFKVGDRVKVKNGVYSHILYDGKRFEIKRYDNNDGTYLCTDIDVGYSAWLVEEALEPAYQEDGYVPYGKLPTPSQPVPIEDRLGLLKDVSIHDLNTVEWCRPSIDIVFNVEQAKELAKRIKEKLSDSTIEFTREYKEDKVMPIKFTFTTKEGYRIDKSNNTKIPTVTTVVEDANYGNSATATCDKADYDERQGVLEALAQLYCKGSFDKEYKKAIKVNKIEDEVMRTCSYCGQIFDTPEERKAHENWHIERRKARRERYLLRKRAKEIAFEEQAQKMATEIIKENK